MLTMMTKAHCPVKYGFRGKESHPPTVPVPHDDVGRFLPSFDDTLWLFHRQWEPHDDDCNIKATLVIVHGTVDHSGVYDELARELNAVGVSVFAQDMRGWGLSDGESMYFTDMDTFCADVDKLYQHIHGQPKYKNVKNRFLMGKSLGGTITANCVARYPDHWTGLIGVSGAYEGDPELLPPSLAMTALYGLSAIVPKLPLKKLFDEHLIVADPGALQAWRDDPLCCKDKVRVGYVVGLFSEIEALKELHYSRCCSNLSSMLMMVGTEDRVVTRSGHKTMLSKCPSNITDCDRALKLYDKGLHNLLQEPSLKEQVKEDLKEWIL